MSFNQMFKKLLYSRDTGSQLRWAWWHCTARSKCESKRFRNRMV